MLALELVRHAALLSPGPAGVVCLHKTASSPEIFPNAGKANGRLAARREQSALAGLLVERSAIGGVLIHRRPVDGRPVEGLPINGRPLDIELMRLDLVSSVSGSVSLASRSAAFLSCSSDTCPPFGRPQVHGTDALDAVVDRNLPS